VYVVTGGCGMVGSNLIAALNARGISDILVVDNLEDGHKFRNIADLAVADFENPEAFLGLMQRGALPPLDAIFHQGACTDTTQWNGRLMMEKNFSFSKHLLEACLEARIPFIYASSAAVYGLVGPFVEASANERPLNVYGYSKKLFDDYVRRVARRPGQSPVAGLRYFNVYGPREQHKGEMASVAYRLFGQLARGEPAMLFGAYGGMGPGEHRRDFVYVEDVALANLWALDRSVSGIFNCGTGRSESFLNMATAVVAAHGSGSIEFKPFPSSLEGHYQIHTQADLTLLRAAGCDVEFRDVRAGIRDYGTWLKATTS
jgi:ADP-L-glycero-D-manno-heptose 6-epimerase